MQCGGGKDVAIFVIKSGSTLCQCCVPHVFLRHCFCSVNDMPGVCVGNHVHRARMMTTTGTLPGEHCSRVVWGYVVGGDDCIVAKSPASGRTILYTIYVVILTPSLSPFSQLSPVAGLVSQQKHSMGMLAGWLASRKGIYRVSVAWKSSPHSRVVIMLYRRQWVEQ